MLAIFRGLAAFLVIAVPACAANLAAETLKSWDEYVRKVRSTVEEQTNRPDLFLWVDREPGLGGRVRKGEVAVQAARPGIPEAVPSGLIHDWIGTIFIPNATIDKMVPAIRDYARYKDFFKPAVIDSKPAAFGDTEDRFSLLLANRSLFSKGALQSEYRATHTALGAKCWYSVSQATRIQEIVGYGGPGAHPLPEDTGTGLIWRLVTVTRFEERDGGVFAEIEVVVLSRDIPASVRWFVDPIVRRVSRSSLVTSLQQTREMMAGR
jgi:hypothetical protein